MTKVYLIRHAEAEGNIYRRAHGHYNGLVTPKGFKQIELLKERFINEKIDAVCSSDLARALTTAGAIAGPRGIEIIRTKALREVDIGIWEDRTWGDIEYSDREMNEYFSNDPARWKIEGGEPYENVGGRMYNYLADIAGQHTGETIAAVSHGFAIRTFLCRLQGIPSHEINKVTHCDNTAVTLLEYDNGKFSIVYKGDNSHLGGGYSTLDKQSWWKTDGKRRPESLRFFALGDVASESLIRIFKAKAGDRAHVDTQYAAYLPEEPVGILGLDTYREANRKTGWISYIHIVPKHRHKSFGTQLLGTAVSDFRKLRREKLRIEMPSGSPGINFMTKCGFTVLTTTETVSLLEMGIKNWA